MDARLLRQFVCLAEQLHFGRAAELCHLSPSTLSRSIRQLEEQLGVPLFVRDNRSVALTAEGRLFLDFARDALSQWQRLQAQLLASSEELRGELSVYCSVTASYSFLHALLRDFRQRHSRVEIKVHTGDPALAVSRVLAGKEDMAIAARPDRLPEGLAFKPLATSPLVFIGPGDGGDLDRLGVQAPPLDWSRIPMILSEQDLARQRVDDWFRRQKLRPHIYAQVAGNEAIVSMVSLGLGLGVVPRIVLDNSPLADQVRVLDLQPALAPFVVGLCTRERSLKSPLVDAFWKGAQAFRD